MNETNDFITLDQVVRVIRRRWWIVAQLMLVAIAVGALLAQASPERYEATATVLIESAADSGSNSRAPGRLNADAAARLVQTRSVAQRVARELGDGRSADELLAAVSASRDVSGAFVNITAHDDSSAGSAQLANSFAREFISARSESVAARVRGAVRAAERELADLPAGRQRSQLAAEIAGLRAAAAPGGIDAELIDPAVAGANRREGALVRWSAIGAGLGLLLGLVLVFSLEALDPRVRALGEMRRLVRAPQLAAMPKGRKPRRGKLAPVLAARPEPFEQLRGALLILNGDRTLRRIVVTSARDRDEGKTVVTANLAVSLARLGLRVCAVDADLRQPSLASEFGLENAVGLADALRGTPLADAMQRFNLPAEGGSNGSGPGPPIELTIVSGGSNDTNAAGLIAGERMQQILEQLDREHDIVLVDCAPLLAVGDALPLLQKASGTILVARHSHTQRRAVIRAASMVTQAHGALLGVVTTGVPKGELALEGYGPWPGSAAAQSSHEL